MMMDFNTILYSKSVEGVVKITINRPDVRNVLNTQVRREIKQAIETVQKDDSVRLLIFTGIDKSFIAGADINDFLTMNPVMADEFVQTLGQNLYAAFEQLKFPVIAMINGYCFGAGMELALCCDMRIASTNAKFGQLELNVGLIPGGGATQRLPRLIGPGRAKEMIFTGRIVDAEEAGRIGLVDKVVAPEKLEAEVEQITKSILSKSPLLLHMAKKAINRGIYTDLAAGLDYERAIFGTVFATEDKVEGIKAFLEKRPAKFKGK
jgi:enoyl-CoA hydratase